MHSAYETLVYIVSVSAVSALPTVTSSSGHTHRLPDTALERAEVQGNIGRLALGAVQSIAVNTSALELNGHLYFHKLVIICMNNMCAMVQYPVSFQK